MRAIVFPSLLLSSALVLGGCAGGYSGQFKGNGTNTGRRVPASQVKTFASKDDAASLTYTELGIAKGSAPSAQEAVDQAKIHCGQGGGNMLILNAQPFQSGSSWVADATCAAEGVVGGAAGSAPNPNVSGTGKPAR